MLCYINKKEGFTVIPNRVVNSDYGPMIINANDQYIGRSIEVYGAWAKDDIDLIASLLNLLLTDRSTVTFYDVGANIGTHTVALAKTFGDRIRVRSFEAQRQIYYVLCGNVAINGLTNVDCLNLAVSDKSGQTLEIDLPDYQMPNNFGGLELIKPIRSDNQYMTKTATESVKTVCLDDFDEHIDFLKMDIEGMEHVALAGAKKVITQSRPICFVEMYKTDTDAVKKFFKKLEYVAYSVKPDDWVFFPGESKYCVNNATKVVL
jgi:FkbM family methyltransferase